MCVLIDIRIWSLADQIVQTYQDYAFVLRIFFYFGFESKFNNQNIW